MMVSAQGEGWIWAKKVRAVIDAMGQDLPLPMASMDFFFRLPRNGTFKFLLCSQLDPSP
jgi:hypothetical protein